jgi:hypothetical protein
VLNLSTCIENGTVVGSCEHSNEHYSSVKCRKFVEKLADYHLIETPAPRVTLYHLEEGPTFLTDIRSLKFVNNKR